jgi:hypothetical protein
MNNLPTDIILRIIREADGGLHTHKGKFSSCMNDIEEVGAETFDARDFLENLCQFGTISIASFIGGARREDCLAEEEIQEIVADMRDEGLH